MTSDVKSTWIDHIPVIWCEPENPQHKRKLVIFLTGLSGGKESLLPYLTDIANAGCVALGFDSWEHGERTTMTSEEIADRTFNNFRRFMWVNIGQTALETMRVIDWAIAELGVEPEINMGGISMGGDISITAAGIDRRIQRVGAVVATPDWLRPGMMDLRKEGHPPLPTGTPDSYSRFIYELLNPMTHLSHYAHAPEIHFVNGEVDDHVPPEAAFRFKSALTELYPKAGNNITIDLLPGLDHGGVVNAEDQWWSKLLTWLTHQR